MNSTRPVDVTFYPPDGSCERGVSRSVVCEAPLTIRVNGDAEYVLMRTPGDDRELTVGFLFTEGIIEGRDDILMLTECENSPNVMEVRTEGIDDGAVPRRNMVIGSSCGLCGRGDIEAFVEDLKSVKGDIRVSVPILCGLPDRVRAQQSAFETTGGTHAAALFDAQGDVNAVREDVGRHNALDKAIGHAVLTGMEVSGLGVFLSGRTSLEMILKAARAGTALVAAVSAPTDAAVHACERLGITLCGFVRGRDVTVYTHDRRVCGRVGNDGRGNR